MINPSDILLVQEFLYRGLLSTPRFENFNVVLEREFLADSSVEITTLWSNPRNGRSGIGLLVEMPKLQAPKPNSIQRTLLCSIGIVEERNLNLLADTGTGVSAEELGERVLDFMFAWMMGLTSGLSPEASALVPAPDLISGEGLVTYRASVALRRNHLPVGRADKPTFSNDAGTVTLTNGSNTPTATIFYTLEDSETRLENIYPGSANPLAIEYSAPFTVSSGQIVRWCAYTTTLDPSHIGYELIA